MLDKLPGEKNEALKLQSSRVKIAKAIWFSIGGLVLLAGILTPILWNTQLGLDPSDPWALVVDAGIGLVLAGPLLAAMLCTLPAFTIQARLTAGITAFTVALLSVAVGVGMVGFPGLFEQEYLVPVPLIFFLLCMPFFLARIVFGWQIHFPQFDFPERSPRVSISGLMVLTGCFAFCCSLLTVSSPVQIQDAIIGALVVFGIGLIVVVPLVLVIMKPKHYLASFCIAVALFFVAASSLQLLVGTDFVNAYRSAFSLTVVFTTVAISLVAARICGAVLLSHTDFSRTARHREMSTGEPTG